MNLENSAPENRENIPHSPRTGKPGNSPSGRDSLFVFANLPHGQSFSLPGGREVTLAGHPVSQLLAPSGEALPGGEYGVSEISASDWSEILRLYGDLAVLKSGLIFTATSRKEGQAMARERKTLRHGLEPVNPESTLTRPDTGR